MKIVILDGHTLNPGDLSWAKWRKYGEVIVYPRTPVDHQTIVERCSGADALITNKFPLSAGTLKALPTVKYIGVTATGYNIVDIAAAKEHGIIVSNVPSYGTASVVQMTFALLLELTHHVQRHSDAVMEGKWSRSPDFCFWDYPLVELAGKTLGIIGMGNIGRKVADVARAFDMTVLGNSRTDKGTPIPELLERSDVVSIHCPLFPETRGLINKENLSRMKPTAFLLNTSRGPIIVEEDLAEALNMGRIAGAGLDVLSIEPPVSGSPLIGAKNCLITPHISWATKEARTRLMTGSLNNLSAFVAGKPVNVVN